jgi:hypothetical protein
LGGTEYSAANGLTIIKKMDGPVLPSGALGGGEWNMDRDLMKATMIPRLSYINAESRTELLGDYHRMVKESLEEIRTEPEKLPQTRYSMLASKYKTIAFLKYALGYPMEEVRIAFADATRALIRVFQLRGQEEAFPAYVLTYDPTKPPTDPTSTHVAPMHPPGTMDYSLTNSWTGYLGICEALVADEDGLASQLAALLWDPPDADYISRRSDICTPNDQRLGYALRELLAGNNEGVLTEIKGIRAGSKETYDTDQATMFRSLVTGKTFAFRDALESYLFWHERRAKDKRNVDSIDFYLSLPGLALCGQAVRRRVCDIDLFPQDNPFLPLELIR